SVRIARQMHLAESEVELIRLAARVHDLGKIAVPDEVLHKQGRLTDEEFAIMKLHPETGAEILAKFPEYRRGRELVLAHHERIDGLGYPHGLAGAAIALGARIIAVADSWDAMTSDRPYRNALESDIALGELLRGRVIPLDAHSMIASTGWIMSLVLPSCLTTPLSVKRRARLPGPGASSFVTTHGPVGHERSRLLPLKYWPPQPFWMSRALTSLRTK